MDSDDYIQIRNVLRVLTVLLPIYPKILSFYSALERRIKNICTAEKNRRHDLAALAKSYNGQLTLKHKDMIEESRFHNVPERTATTTTTAATSSSNNNTTHSGMKKKEKASFTL